MLWYTTQQQQQNLSLSKGGKTHNTEAFWVTLILHRFISLLSLKPGAEEWQNRSCSPTGPIAHLPLLHEELLQPGAAWHDGCYPRAGDPPAVDHLAGLQLQAPSDNVAQTNVSDFWAVGEHNLFELRATFAYLSKRHVTYDLYVEARWQVVRQRNEHAQDDKSQISYSQVVPYPHFHSHSHSQTQVHVGPCLLKKPLKSSVPHPRPRRPRNFVTVVYTII